ncbi:CTP--2,3-di-O-geranylgeranyl-sn-glycero-1-phosphate cytidyltransferase [Candidatus Woesearchaeota archaeon]|jgi:dolichol kinase|nr:CTP--2,3-di-O-geranylgeranyl-sn-glycero-1-phosphate cytidyltransferase [Candidatus Woesearchaeota archaeon]MDP6648273.1 CTP--2,3-di-O-geranylgeranyl-sn-glycero-1-phosphate cytidyltransferase [Candidatus Woesearchaeota archaeon]|tara:strand:+ start:29732 stop:30340 length:609 start_codon:yes stop_codon:yes gene_type:complete
MTWGFLHEIGRKIIHITILIVLAAFFIIQDILVSAGYTPTLAKQVALLSLVALLIVFLVLEYFRLELNWKMPFFSQFIRAKEQHRMYGVIYFLSATTISLAVFDYKIALAALLMTTFGDMAAALIGKRYGTTLIYGNKTWAGFSGELAVNLIVGFLILDSIYVILGMAIVATIVETLVDELDDNLLIPIFSGFVGQIILFSL